MKIPTGNDAQLRARNKSCAFKVFDCESALSTLLFYHKKGSLYEVEISQFSCQFGLGRIVTA